MDHPFSVLIVNSATKRSVTYYLCQVLVQDEEISYCVDRRYSDFLALDERLHSIYGKNDTLSTVLNDLPQKVWFGSKTDSFIKLRHYHLQQYLNSIHRIPFLVNSKTYRDFLKIESFFPNSIPIRPSIRFLQTKSQHNIRFSIFNIVMIASNVFISIAGCHPNIALSSPTNSLKTGNRIKTNLKTRIVNNLPHLRKKKHSPSLKSVQYPTPTLETSDIEVRSSNSSSLLSSTNHSSPLSMLPSPNEIGGCIQV